MSKPTIAEIDVEALLTKQRHDMMLAMPPKDGFCRFYGDYVPVGKKAPVDWVAKWILDNLDDIGYRGNAFTQKPHEELASTSSKNAVAAKRVGKQLPPSGRQCGSISAMGPWKNAVRTWQGQIRTTKSHTEENIDRKLPVAHPLMGWLVPWAREVLLKYVARPSGRTAYESIQGHRAKYPLVRIGEALNFKLEQDESRRRRVERDWSTGVETRTS